MTTTEQTSPTTDPTAAVDAYLAAWNERDEARRAALVAQAWADDARLVDPPMAGTGHAEISAMAAALHAQFDGHRFARASAVDAHNGRFRVAWDLVGPDGAVALTGLDTGVLAADGRVAEVTGFFGELPLAT